VSSAQVTRDDDQLTVARTIFIGGEFHSEKEGKSRPVGKGMPFKGCVGKLVWFIIPPTPMPTLVTFSTIRHATQLGCGR
jgi:hypothetical protein